MTNQVLESVRLEAFHLRSGRGALGGVFVRGAQRGGALRQARGVLPQLLGDLLEHHPRHLAASALVELRELALGVSTAPQLDSALAIQRAVEKAHATFGARLQPVRLPERQDLCLEQLLEARRLQHAAVVGGGAPRVA